MSTELKQLQKDHHIEPPRHIWNQIEGRISQEVQGKKLSRMRIAVVVASFLIFGGVFSYIKWNSISPVEIIYAQRLNKLKLEKLPSSGNDIYDFNQVLALRASILKTDPNFGKRIR